MKSDVVVDPVLRQRYTFERKTGSDGSVVLLVDAWVEEGGGVTPHVHPSMEERFHVLEGHPEFLAGRKWQIASPGETVTVPPGARHAYRNRAEEEAHIVCEASPPSTLQEFLEDAAALNRSGKLTRHAIPKGPSAILQGVLMAHHYRDMVELHFPPMPPPRLQRLIFPALARLAERRGYRPGRLGDRA